MIAETHSHFVIHDKQTLDHPVQDRLALRQCRGETLRQTAELGRDVAERPREVAYLVVAEVRYVQRSLPAREGLLQKAQFPQPDRYRPGEECRTQNRCRKGKRED